MRDRQQEECAPPEAIVVTWAQRRVDLGTLTDVDWSVADRELVSWPGTPETDLGWCGYKIESRPDAMWLLNAMYERESGSAELTYDQQ